MYPSCHVTSICVCRLYSHGNYKCWGMNSEYHEWVRGHLCSFKNFSYIAWSNVYFPQQQGYGSNNCSICINSLNRLSTLSSKWLQEYIKWLWHLSYLLLYFCDWLVWYRGKHQKKWKESNFIWYSERNPLLKQIFKLSYFSHIMI